MKDLNQQVPPTLTGEEKFEPMFIPISAMQSLRLIHQIAQNFRPLLLECFKYKTFEEMFECTKELKMKEVIK